MDGDTSASIFRQVDSTIEVPVVTKDEVDETRDPLTFDLDDDVFIKRAKALIKQSQEYNNTVLHLESRRSENEKYLFGRQLEGITLKEYNARFLDNIIWESLSYVAPMALSQLPTFTVTPGNDGEVSAAIAKDVSDIINADNKTRARKRLLGLAYRQRPVYFYAVIKPFWNPEKGKYGDYDAKVVHPNLVVLDHTAQTNNPDDMGFIAENVEYTVKEWVMRFPKKAEAFYEKLREDNVFNSKVNEKNDEGMNSKVKGWEIWFTWYDKQDGKEEYQRIEGVAWFYKDFLFDKMKNPYWDWEGEKQTFRLDKLATVEDMQEAMATNNFADFHTEKIYRNHFDFPRKPYIILGYDQWGKTPVDETSWVEQSLFLQQNYDKRGRQITEMLDRARGKHVFSSDGGVKAEDIEEMDLNDPDEDILITGDVRKFHAFIPAEQPSSPMMQNFTELRERIFDKAGVHGPARGEVDMGTAATNNQLAREGDFTRSDDQTDDIINYACEELANWTLQFMKLFYTEDHFRYLVGEDGTYIFKRINQDYIEDGLQIVMSASGTDKLKRQQNAMDTAKLGYIDPLSFFEDMGMSDPEGRTERLMLFKMYPDMYLQKFVKKNKNLTDLQEALMNGVQTGEVVDTDETGIASSNRAQRDIMFILAGKIPDAPLAIDASYLKLFTVFMHSPDLERLLQIRQDLKPQILAFAQKVNNLGNLLQQQTQSVNGMPTVPPQMAGMPNTQPIIQQPPQQGNVGPVGEQPNPTNTARVAITPPGLS